MNKLTLTVAGMLLCITALMAQSPVADPDTLKDPVKQIDPEPKVLPQNDNYTEERVKITPKQIPEAVRQTLTSSTQYAGWEKASIYKDKKGNRFTIELTRADTTRAFHFDKAGRPVND